MTTGGVLGRRARLSRTQIALLGTVVALLLALELLLVYAYVGIGAASQRYEDRGASATTMANVQREILRLALATRAHGDVDDDALEIQRAVLENHLRVARAAAATRQSSRSLERLGVLVGRYDAAFAEARRADEGAQSGPRTRALLAELEREAKRSYDAAELEFYESASTGLAAQKRSRLLLLGVGACLLLFAFPLARSLHRAFDMQLKRLAAFPRLSPFPVVELARGEVQYANAAAEALAARLGSDVSSLLPRGAISGVETQLAQATLAPISYEIELSGRTVSWSFLPVSSDGVVHGYGEDISERRRAEAELKRQAELNEHQALHDALTTLPNRVLFRDRIKQAIERTRREGGQLAVLMLDLDRFKEINDTLGHHSGDLLLQELSARLQATVRAGDTVARLGGDEFGLLLPMSSNPTVAGAIDRILRAFERPFVIQDLTLNVEGSIGVALYPDHGDDVELLLKRADVAMYAAKEAASVYAVYDVQADEHHPARLTIASELRRAIDHRELALHFQPKAALRTGQVASVEALVRWQHPQRGLLAPSEFMPVAEQTGLIRPLTFYVLDEALRQCRRWKDDERPLAVAVNLSVRNLLDPSFPAEVAKLLEKWDIEPGLLQLEITESAIVADPFRMRPVLEQLNALGAELSIDDFGTGYSSLAYLTRLPVDEIKIDRSFVMNMAKHEDSAVIVRSIIGLARDLGLSVVAEGVETQDAWETLKSHGCDIAQGYFLSRPLPPEELDLWLDRLPQTRGSGESAADGNGLGGAQASTRTA